MSRKLQSSLKKIDSVFERMFRHKISVKGKNYIHKDYEDRKGMSENTKNTYKNMMKSLMRDLHKEFGIADITRVKKHQVNDLIERRMSAHQSGELSQAYNLKTLIAAVNSFNFGVENTKIFKRKFEIADVQEIRGKMRENNVIRKTASSQNLKAKRPEAEKVIENIKDSGYKTENRRLAEEVSKVSMLTGGRITAILRLRSRDIKELPTGGGLITFNNDKGGLTRTVRVDSKTFYYLDNLSVGKKPSDRLFFSKRADGTFKSIKETRKDINRIISRAGSFLDREEKVKIKLDDGSSKTVKVDKKFSVHSFRKSFADERAKIYYNYLDNQKKAEKLLSEFEKFNPGIREKLKSQVDRINQNRKIPRSINREELSIFFTSVDLGHFRNDVIVQYYIDIKSFREYQKTVL